MSTESETTSAGKHELCRPGRVAAWLASPVVFFLLVASSCVRQRPGDMRRANVGKPTDWLMSGGAVSAVSIFIVVTTKPVGATG